MLLWSYLSAIIEEVESKNGRPSCYPTYERVITVQKPRILVVGDVSIELLVRAERLPLPGGAEDVKSFDYLPGGNGTHSSVALARLGADSVISAKLGDDSYAEELAEYLSDEGVDARFLAEARGENTALEIILAEEGGASRRLCYAGALLRFSESDVEESFICYPDAVMLHGDLPSAVLDKTVRMAAIKELPLFLASLPDPSRHPLAQLGPCEILTVDEAQTERVTGIRPADQERCMKACMALTRVVKAKYVVLRLGERGCFLYDGTYHRFIAAYDVPVPKGVSADEAFSAALALEYLRSDGDIRRACDYATIVSAVYLTRGGGLRAYPSAGDVKQFIQRNEIEFYLERPEREIE